MSMFSITDQLEAEEQENYRLQAKLDKIKKEWKEYKLYLQHRYPKGADEKQWQFTCPYHKKIDDLLT